MEKATLNATYRDSSGKGVARSLRRSGSMPAVIYKRGEAFPLVINRKEMLQFMHSTAGEQVLVHLRFPDDSTRNAIVKEYQVDPAHGELLHADFMEVSLTENVRVTVHVVTVGEAVGVKRDKGILQHELREVEIECLPDSIPGRLEVDVSGVLIGHSVHVSDIKPPEGVKILTDPGEVLAIVAAPSIMEKEAAEAAAPEAATAAAAAAEPAAPEVIKKGKKEEAKGE